MTSRQLELTIRALADVKGLDTLQKEAQALIQTLRQSATAFDNTATDARQLADAFGQLSAEEQKSVQNAARTATAIEQAAAARSAATQQQAEQAALRTAAAEERLVQAQAGTTTAVSRAAAAEEKLAQERQRTFQATARSEKEELAVAKAREQLRAATARAEKAEQSLNTTRKSGGLALDIVTRQFQAFVGGGLALRAGQQLLAFGKDAVSAASDAEEGAAKFDQVFRDLASSTRTNLEGMAEANRRSIYDLVDFASTLQDTFVPLGFAREEAAALSTTITQLGIDIAAFSNKADAEVIQNLTSAIVGNHEAVRSYGIVLTETVLKQELSRMGAEKLTGAALEVAKAQARVNIIMRASADAQGAAVREADSYANTLKAWDAATTELKVSIGEGLLPFMTRLADTAIAIAKALNDDYAHSLLTTENANRKLGASAQELAADLKGVVTEIRESGDLLARARLTQGNIGNAREVRDVLTQIAQQSTSVAEFETIFNDIGLATFYLTDGTIGLGDSYNELIQRFYDVARAAPALQQSLADAAEMEAVYEARRRKVFEADLAMQMENVVPAWITDSTTATVMAAWGAWADDLGDVAEATREAAAAQQEWRSAFGESFSAAPVDDLIAAQRALADAQGEWQTGAIDNSTEIADIQKQLAGDLTREQEKQLRDQLQDLDDFSAAYLGIVRQLEGDLSDTQRLDLIDQLSQLQGQQGQAQRYYTGDIEAAEEARQAIIEANKAIQDSYYERAYNAIAARMIEEGNFQQMADLAVNLGLMTQEEADLRMEYAQTVDALDALSASTAFYGLTASQQAGAIKSLAAGVYATADAALKAQENLKKVSDFYSTAPDSSQIGDFYRNLASDAGADEGILTTIGVTIDEADQAAFATWHDNLQEYDAAVWTTDVGADYGTTMDDFESMQTQLHDLTAKPWVIKIKYETQGGAPSGGDGSGGGGGGGGGNAPATATPQATGPTYVIEGIRINNYGTGDLAGRTRAGVLAAVRSLP